MTVLVPWLDLPQFNLLRQACRQPCYQRRTTHQRMAVAVVGKHRKRFFFVPMALQARLTRSLFTQDRKQGPINFYDYAGEKPWVVLFFRTRRLHPVCTPSWAKFFAAAPGVEKRNGQNHRPSVDSAERPQGLDRRTSTKPRDQRRLPDPGPMREKSVERAVRG